jgi:hypothetical protein
LALAFGPRWFRSLETRRLVALTALIAAMLGQAHAAEKPTALYDRAPWVVNRLDIPGMPVCIGSVSRPEKGIMILGTTKASAIIINKSDWDFEEHEGPLLLKVDDSGMGAGNAVYSGDAVRIEGAKEAIYVIMLGLVVPGYGELEVMGGEDNRVIATFDIAGVGAALEAWKTCVDAL